MKVGLFFGSFNPIHVGHIAIAQYMAEFSDLEEVWFVVSPQNPEKERATLLDDYQRLEMVHRATESYDNIKVSSIEFSLPKPSFTINTLAHLVEKYSNIEFALIMGGDNLATFDKWKNYKYILDNFSLYVYSRPNSIVPKEFKNHQKIHLYNAPQMEISSSFIRESIRNKKNISAYMPKEAWQYLDEMNFYKK